MIDEKHQREHEVRIGIVVPHGGYNWIYEKADLEQGGYYLCDPDLKKVAVILPFNRAHPIGGSGKNARLLTRPYGSNDWYEQGPYTLREALTNGNSHAHVYRIEMMVREFIGSVPTKTSNRECERNAEAEQGGGDEGGGSEAPKPKTKRKARSKVERARRRRNSRQEREQEQTQVRTRTRDPGLDRGR